VSARFAERVVVITGAGKGIGAVAARTFAAEGARVVIVDVDAAEGMATAEAIRAAGGAATSEPTDITDSASVAAMTERVATAFGRIDILYNNAGGTRPGDGRITEIAEDAFWNAIRVDLFGTWLCCKHILPHMARRGSGAVINTASISGIIGHRNVDAYTSAKGGIMALTRSLAVEFAASGVRVNAIAPGATKTERIRNMLDQGRVSPDLVNRHLWGLMEPQRIADVAAFLASDAALGITGQTIVVDGGASITAVNREEA
jgi:NAD(P)-dependent dehydrogenase (short-subunit alcohol dehydrogenase family)